jgi:hypothetical protein
MADATLRPSEVQAYVHDRAQDGLRGLAVYDGADLDVRYARSDLGAAVEERFGAIHESVRAATASPDGDHWGTLGRERASIQIRDEAAVMHLRPTGDGSQCGMLVELDARVTQSLAEFLTSVRRVAFDGA